MPCQYETVQLRVVAPRPGLRRQHRRTPVCAPIHHPPVTRSPSSPRRATAPTRWIARFGADFEWLIVDNGSSDGTAELIERFKSEADFPIRYFWQEDQGKQGSMNRAVQLADGKLFLTLDSDDGCVPDALERFKYHWDSIPESIRDGFTGVTALCFDEHGELVGTRFPDDPTDSDSREIRYRYKVEGEKWGFHRIRCPPWPVTRG